MSIKEGANRLISDWSNPLDYSEKKKRKPSPLGKYMPQLRNPLSRCPFF